MKTSVIEVRDMLSVLSVDEVEKRIGEVPGVESATVNFAAKSATVRYDETRLEVADIKSDVRQRGYEPAGDPPHKHAREHKPGSEPMGQPMAPAAPDSPSAPVDALPKANPISPEPAKPIAVSPAAPVTDASPAEPAKTSGGPTTADPGLRWT